MPLTAAEQAELVVEIEETRRLFDDLFEVWDDETARVRVWHAILWSACEGSTGGFVSRWTSRIPEATWR